MTEDTEIRKEIVCQSCRKSRFLSMKEASEDGWAMHTGLGIVCDKCLPRYGIPTTFLRSPSYAGLCESENEDIGIEIKFQEGELA